MIERQKRGITFTVEESKVNEHVENLKRVEVCWTTLCSICRGGLSQVITVCLFMHSNVGEKMVNPSRGTINFRASK